MGGGAARRTSVEFTDPGGQQPAGIYGWRKQCLYATILFITVIVIMNLALTVWILRILDFSIDGLHLGKIRLTDTGLHVLGETEIVNALYTSKIASKNNRHISIESSRDIAINARNKDQEITNSFYIGKSSLEATCGSFEVKDTAGKSRFRVTDKEVAFGLDEVKIDGKILFNGSLVTPQIRGPLHDSLRIESSSREILLSGKQGVSIEAPFGDIEVKSVNHINFKSDQSITLNSTKVFFKGLEVSSPNQNGKLYDDVYQLCMCGNGRLFLGPAAGPCSPSRLLCVY